MGRDAARRLRLPEEVQRGVYHVYEEWRGGGDPTGLAGDDLPLGSRVARLTGAEIAHLPNPRQEAEENELCVENRRLLGYGLDPVTLEDGLMLEIAETARRYAQRADLAKIPCVSAWNAERAAATAGAAQAQPVAAE